MAPFIVTFGNDDNLSVGLPLVYTEGKPITGFGDSYAFQLFGKGYFLGIPVPAVTMIIVFVVLWFMLHKMSFGRKTYAIGGNEKAALISGIQVDRVKVHDLSISWDDGSISGDDFNITS